MLAATLALLVQALVVQLHWHSPAENAGGIASAFRHVAIATPDTGHQSSSRECVICLEQALSAHCTLPPLVTFVDDRQRGPDLVQPKGLFTLFVRQVSHAWLSRGPPALSV